MSSRHGHQHELGQLHGLVDVVNGDAFGQFGQIVDADVHGQAHGVDGGLQVQPGSGALAAQHPRHSQRFVGQGLPGDGGGEQSGQAVDRGPQLVPFDLVVGGDLFDQRVANAVHQLVPRCPQGSEQLDAGRRLDHDEASTERACSRAGRVARLHAGRWRGVVKVIRRSLAFLFAVRVRADSVSRGPEICMVTVQQQPFLHGDHADVYAPKEKTRHGTHVRRSA